MAKNVSLNAGTTDKFSQTDGTERLSGKGFKNG